jgi:hypothetical protein
LFHTNSPSPNLCSRLPIPCGFVFFQFLQPFFDFFTPRGIPDGKYLFYRRYAVAGRFLPVFRNLAQNRKCPFPICDCTVICERKQFFPPFRQDFPEVFILPQPMDMPLTEATPLRRFPHGIRRQQRDRNLLVTRFYINIYMKFCEICKCCYEQSLPLAPGPAFGGQGFRMLRL